MFIVCLPKPRFPAVAIKRVFLVEVDSFLLFNVEYKVLISLPLSDCFTLLKIPLVFEVPGFCPGN